MSPSDAVVLMPESTKRQHTAPQAGAIGDATAMTALELRMGTGMGLIHTPMVEGAHAAPAHAQKVAGYTPPPPPLPAGTKPAAKKTNYSAFSKLG